MDKIINKKWYVLKCKKGNEDKIKMQIIDQFKINKTFIEESNIKIIKKRIKNKLGNEILKNIYPGYIYVSIIMNNKNWYLIRNIKDVYGFLGSTGKSSKPVSLSKKEIAFLIQEEQQYKNDNILYDTDIELEQMIKILEHNLFKNQIGVVKSINLNEGIFEIEVVFMGKKHIIYEKFKNVEKI